MTYEELLNANASIRTTPIEKKDKKTGRVSVKEYAEVNQRIKVFRMLYPTGAISTELVSLNDGVAIFKASIMDGEGKLLGTGTAYEKEGSSFINQTSYIENCETSAVGRALAMCGIGIDLSVASYEEVANAMKNQEAYPNTDEMIETIIKKHPEGSDWYKNVVNHFQVESINQLTDEQLKVVYNKVKN